MADSTSTFFSSLGPGQKRVLGVALTMAAAVIVTTIITGLIWLVREFLAIFSSVLWPLALAGILALIFRPVVRRWEKLAGISRTSSIFCLYGMAGALGLGLATFLLPKFFSQAIDLVDQLPELAVQLRNFVLEKYPKIVHFLETNLSQETVQQLGAAITEWLRAVMQEILPAVSRLGDWLLSMTSLATGLAVVPVYLFYFLLMDRDPTIDWQNQLDFLPEYYRQDLVFLVREFVNILVAFFRGQLIIAFLIGLCLSAGFSIIGLSYGLLLGFILGLLNIVPYLGTILGLSITIPLAYFQPDGGGLLIALVLLVFMVTQMLEGYVFTPRIMGRTTGLHPLAIIVSIFFWGKALGGLLGMILAIPLTAFLVVAWRLAKRNYLTPNGRPPTVEARPSGSAAN